MALNPTGALDFWNLFVVGVFGGFWMAVIGLMVVMFIIMGVLGRLSIYSVTWYCIMFMLAMTLGYGFVTLNIFITLALLVAFYFSWVRYLNS